MLAIIAAVIFGLALLLDFANVHWGDAFTNATLVTLGLLLLALHLAGIGRPWRGRDRRAV
jgi:hypothetical protein